MEFKDRSFGWALGVILAFYLLITMGAAQFCGTPPCSLTCSNSSCSQSCLEGPCTMQCSGMACNQSCTIGNCQSMTCTATDKCRQLCIGGNCTTVSCTSKFCDIQVGKGSGPYCKGDICEGKVGEPGVTFKCDALNTCKVECTNGGCTVEADLASNTVVDCLKNTCNLRCKKGATCSCSNTCVVTYTSAAPSLLSQLGWIFIFVLMSFQLM